MAATAAVVVVNDMHYHYDAGVFYQPYNGGYQAVAPPPGAVVPELPPDRTPVQVGDDTYFYFGGIFYVQAPNGFQVVPAPAGAIVYNLPQGCTQVQAGNITYLQYNGDYYQPVEVDGQPAYEVVNIEE